MEIDIKRKMAGLFTAFFMGLNEADKQIMKSGLGVVDEVGTNQTQKYIKSPFLNGINQGKITEEQRQHFYKVLNLAEQKWRHSKGFDDPDKMQLILEKRGMVGIIESINCEPIDMGLSTEYYYPVRTNADQFEVEKIAEYMLIYQSEIRFKCSSFHHKRIFDNIVNGGNVVNELHNTTQVEWDKREFDDGQVKYVYNTYNSGIKYKNTIKENDEYFLIVFNKTNDNRQLF